ncbi:chemotaxis response regulator protein-glutamate methylesterase [mine drainage metagenome]|uniref:protein-glutamate methylesterase n=1 Tax=mine drainage metagenome TaxID=410659 RepID=A0A1J5PLZ3_9ZZZZ
MRARMVAIGASTGGLHAIRTLLPMVPAGPSAALVIVLHRHIEESGDLLPILEAVCALPIGFPLDKELILPGRIYVAPPNYHLLLEGGHFAYSLDAPEDFARPSIDVVFESVANAYREAACGVVLTGMRKDGALGLAAIARNGGVALVQSPSEAFASSMPLAALGAVPSAQELSRRGIGEWLVEYVGG